MVVKNYEWNSKKWDSLFPEKKQNKTNKQTKKQRKNKNKENNKKQKTNKIK